jgi:integrase
MTRRPPLQHPLAPLFERASDSLCAALSLGSHDIYRFTTRKFLRYLGTHYPDVGSLQQLRRDPHILAWFARLHSQKPSLATRTCISLISHLRSLLYELALTEHLPDLAFLLRREDIPKRPQLLPRSLTPQQDQLLQQELLRRNDLESNVLLLLRHTGMRIGECADLTSECLRSSPPDHFAIHVPLGKLKTERMVPVDGFVRDLVLRLRFFRSVDPLPPDGRLLARPYTKECLTQRLRDYLHEVCTDIGLPTRIVPHQLRHTYATEMFRSGITLPALMKLLGHSSPTMTMIYLDIIGTDLQREFHQALSKPRHLAPQPKGPSIPASLGISGVLDSLLAAQHVLEMFRRSLPPGAARKHLDRLSNRLTKITSEVRDLTLPGKISRDWPVNVR